MTYPDEGTVVGERTVIAYLPGVKHNKRVRVRCSCGRESEIDVPDLLRTKRCRSCARRAR